MKIFSAEQIKAWYAFTISNEPISSINLLERAAIACCNWMIGKNFGQYHFRIFCGKGNIRVMDITGRLIEQKTIMYADSEIKLGEKFIPGVCLTEITKGVNRRIVKLIKQ